MMKIIYINCFLTIIVFCQIKNAVKKIFRMQNLSDKQKSIMKIICVDYFRNAKYTAMTRQINAAKWFQWSDSPLNNTVAKITKIVRVITS